MQGASEVSNFISFESLSAMEFRDPIMFINFFKTNNKFLKKKLKTPPFMSLKVIFKKVSVLLKLS